MKVLTWNVQSAVSNSQRSRELKKRILESGAEIAVLTEVTIRFLEALGGTYCSCDANYGYENTGDRRKVAIWSRKKKPSHIEHGKEQSFPSGRFITANTLIHHSKVRIIGVCIPWSHAHVSTGRKDRRAWQDHEVYLNVLQSLASTLQGESIIAGDFNQRIPRSRQPKRVAIGLANTLENYFVHTGGHLLPANKQSIDHIVTSPGLSMGSITTMSNIHEGRALSDHFGVLGTIL